MRYSILVLLSACFVQSAFADSTSTAFLSDYFSEGHFISAGTVGNSGRNSVIVENNDGIGTNTATSGSVAPTLQYFVFDKLAVGLGVDVMTNNSGLTSRSYTNFDIGPAATYYFWTTNKMAAHAGAAYFENAFTATSQTRSSGPRPSSNLNFSSGLDFVATHSMSIGPVLNYSLISGAKAPSGVSTGAAFSFYL